MSGLIRTARDMTEIPEGKPKRYKNANGYWRLRWKLPDGGYIEAYEHRFVAGLPASECQVHHLNHNKEDNRPENLKVMTKAEHAAYHGQDRQADVSKIISLYELGHSQPSIAKIMGINASTVSRALKRSGHKARTNAGHYEFGVDKEAVVRALMSGKRVPHVAREFAVPEGTVRRIGRESGWRGQPGRPARQGS